MTAERCLYIWLMPWLSHTERIEFGEINVWDFYSEGPKLVPDSSEMLRLAQFVSSFRDRYDHELSNVGIIQLGDIPFDSPSKEYNSKVLWASKAIAFSFLIESITSIVVGGRNGAVGNSERFQTMQMAIDEENFLHYYYAGLAGASALKGKHIVFREPPQNIDKSASPNKLLMEKLSRINDSHYKSELWNKLDVCFEWFMSCWSESPSYPARFISLMTAFEALVKQNHSKSPKMAQYVTDLCNWSDLPKTEFHMLRNRPVNFNKPSKFIIQFAQYRNDFVHGSSTIPWGWVKYCIAGKQFDPRQTMSLVIYSIVAAQLLKIDDLWGSDSVAEDVEKAVLKVALDKVYKALHWNTDEPLEASPHEKQQPQP